MKTFRLITLVALALMAADCSKIDNDYAPGQPTEGSRLVTFTATITLDDEATTRALSGPDGENNIHAEWATGEHVALVYQKSPLTSPIMADAVITAHADRTATISATMDVTGMITGVNTGVTLIYPYSTVCTSGDNIGQVRSDLWASQTGTLEDISQYRDLRRGSGRLIIDKVNNTATLQNAVTMVPQAAIWKLTLSQAIDASHPLKVCDFDDNALLSTVTPASETNEVYVALPAAAKKTYRFYVKTDNKRFIKNGKAQLEAGKFYQTTLTLTEHDPNIDYIIPEDIGSVIGTNGNVYANASEAGNAGATAEAMICSAGYDGHGMAIELNSSPQSVDVSSAKSNAVNKPALAGHSWKLPSKDDWQSMVDGCGGAQGFITKYDGTGVELCLYVRPTGGRGPTEFWTSTTNILEQESGIGAYVISFSVTDSSYSFGFNKKVTIGLTQVKYYSLACLAF